MKRQRGKIITNQSDIEYILSIKADDITTDLFKDLFGASLDQPARFNTNDEFLLPAGKLYNKTDITTTVGRYIFNLFIMYPTLIKEMGYQNYTFTKGKTEDLDSSVATMLLNDKITTDDYVVYIDKMNWLGYGQNKFLVEGVTLDLFLPLKEVTDKRNELFEKHKKEIDKGDVVLAADIESKLVPMAQEMTKGTVGFELFNSGAAKKFGNNYKNMAISRGPIKNMASSEDDYFISKNNLVDGIPKDEFHYYADLPVLGSHSRAIGTRDGGYQKKILEASFQSEQVSPNTDCNSKGYLNVKLTKGNKGTFIFRYILSDSGDLIRLDPDTIDKYVGKTVKMRSPMYCINDNLCSKCMGDLYEKIGLTTIGLLTGRIGTRLLNTALDDNYRVV